MTGPREGAERELLEARARALARPFEADASSSTLQFFVFEASGETFAADARNVPGVFRLRHLSPVPGARPCLAGLTSWRGEILPLLDLEQALDRPREGLDDRAWVVVLERDGRRIGILTGEPGGMIEIGEEELLRPGKRDLPDALVRATTRDAVQVLAVGALLDTLTSEESS